MTKYMSIVTGSSNMNLIFCVCLLNFVFLTNAQTKVKCFDKNKSRDKTGIILDCSNVETGHPYTIEEWIQYHAFFDDGILANRVLNINLENNNFRNIFVLPQMPSLKKISFKNNEISTIANQAFSKLPSLIELDMSFNSLSTTELRRNVFIKWRTQQTNDEAPLKILKLGHNNIHSLSPECFEYLTKLEELELNNNPISIIDQQTEIALSNLKNLKVLDLGFTGISEFPTNMFSQLTNVQTLFLDDNKFQKIPREIRDMPLAYLNVNANPINRLDSESFVGLDKLQQLIISAMPNLTDIESGTFVPLKKLTTLQMDYNPNLSNIHQDAFRDHTANQQWPLRQLSISNNNFNSIDSKLYPWEKLDLFDAKSNRWICDCRLLWLANYTNVTFTEIPEKLLYYRCYEPKDLNGTLVSQLNDHITCDEFNHGSVYHSHGHVTRLRHFIIVIGLVIGIFVIGTLINMGCREFKKILKPRICVPARFSTGIKYKPADFEENIDTLEVPVKNSMIYGRSPIVINRDLI